MSQKGLVAYYSYLETMEDLTNEEFGSLIRAALEYGKTGKIPELKGNEKILFKTIKFQIDQDIEKYKNKCEKNKENADKRWNQPHKEEEKECECIKTKENNAIECERIQSNAKDANINENENESENESVNEINKKVSPNGDTKKDVPPQKVKHKYGEAKNVLLTDEQHASLQADYGDKLPAMVEYLSNYIATHGKKYKDHNRVLRDWVENAVRKKELEKQELDKREERLKTGYSCPKTGKHHKLAETSDNPDDWR